jgi:hypothetical protein
LEACFEGNRPIITADPFRFLLAKDFESAPLP